MKLPSVRTFAPENWSEVDYFSTFCGGTHDFDSVTKRALSGVRNHYDKAQLLISVARKLAPNVSLDRTQLNTQGYTAGQNAREFSAVIEEVFTELYSVVDCTRKVIVATRKRCQGMPTGSTRKLFAWVTRSDTPGSFPPEIANAIRNANWYTELLYLRDELTHLDVGSCSVIGDGDKISYSHHGVSKAGKPLVINDILGHAHQLAAEIQSFVSAVFAYFNSELAPSEVDQLCGFFLGRAYMRRLPSQRPVTFDSGTCAANGWFDTTPGYRCPFADSCGAYRRVGKGLATQP